MNSCEEFLKGKRISVFGVGISGMAAIKLLKFFDCQLEVINLGAPESWSLPAGEDLMKLVGKEHCFAQEDPGASEVLSNSDLIILSPGISVEVPCLVSSRKKGIPIWSEIELAFRTLEKNCPPIVAITGTNGKTTTCSLVAEMLRSAGKKVFLGGNIGTPFCSFALEDIQLRRQLQLAPCGSGVLGGRDQWDFIVLELSSFQLETIDKFRPFVAAILNLSAGHSERYPSKIQYGLAKLRIAKNMQAENFLFFPKDLDQWMVEKLETMPLGRIPLELEKASEELQQKFKLDLNNFLPVGEHNLWNLSFAVQMVNLLLEEKRDEQGKNQSTFAIQKTIDQFRGIPFRIEKLIFPKKFPTLKLEFYNDAKSTNLMATLTALKSLQSIGGNSQETYLIFGGKKRSDFDVTDPLWKSVFEIPQKIYLIGETTDEIFSLFSGSSVAVGKFEQCYSLERAVEKIHQGKLQGIILFSPGHPSFDQYRDYVHRGKSFQELIAEKWFHNSFFPTHK